MDCQLLTPTRTLFSGEVDEVNLRTKSGQLGILPHHENIVEIVAEGDVSLRVKSGKDVLQSTSGGIVQVKDNRLCIMIDELTPEHANCNGLIQEAFARAEKIHQDAKGKQHIEHASHLVDRGSVRLGVTRLRRRHHRTG